MLEEKIRYVAVGTAFCLAAFVADAAPPVIWSIGPPAASYMVGAKISCNGNSAPGAATIQQQYSLSPGIWNNFGPANGSLLTPPPYIGGPQKYWQNPDRGGSGGLVASIPVQNVLQYRIDLSTTQSGHKYSTTYLVF